MKITLNDQGSIDLVSCFRWSNEDTGKNLIVFSAGRFPSAVFSAEKSGKIIEWILSSLVCCSGIVSATKILGKVFLG
jgi:hypothetical protein